MNTVCYRGTDVPEEMVRALAGRSFLASASFASIWAARGGSRVVWGLEEQGRLVAALPGVEFGRRPLRRFMAMPNGLYGRLCIAEEFRPERDRIAAALLEAISGDEYVKSYVFDFFGEILPEAVRARAESQVAILADIGAPDWRPPDRNLRQEIRKATRGGLSARRLDWSIDRDSFLKLVQNIEGLQGRKTRYSEAFWEGLACVAQADDRVCWYMAEHEGTPVATHIYFVEDEMLFAWQWYYDRRFSVLKANQYLVNHACLEAKARGVQTLNLGATPKGAEGTMFFKRRWGGYPRTYTHLALRRGIGRWL